MLVPWRLVYQTFKRSGRCVAEPSASELWFGLSSSTMLGGTAEFGDLGTSHRQR